MQNRSVNLNSAEERHHRTLALTMRLLDMTDADLAAVLSLSRQAAQQRRTGHARLHDAELVAICRAWHLRDDLFDLDPVMAAKWVLEHHGCELV
jgi:hypothetical protein